MSFITRCPACATAFKVVPDQLKISDGWVRCGRCQQVFDATLDLQPGWPAAGAAAPPPTPTHPPEQAPPAPVAVEVLLGGTLEGPLDSPQEPSPRLVTVQGAPMAQGDPDPAPPLDAAVVWDGVASDPLAGPPPAPWATHAALAAEPSPQEPVAPPDPVWHHSPMEEAAPEAAQPLSFVRQAQRRAFWRRAPVRVVLWLSVGLLLVGLAVQWLWQAHDQLAARLPATRGVLERICAPLGCRVSDWQAPDVVHIDSSALLRRSPGRYVFDLVLKNNSPWPVALPAIELTLTDAMDRVLVRRVLPPSAWSPGGAVLSGAAEQPVRLELALPAAEAQVMTGYRALLFYP